MVVEMKAGSIDTRVPQVPSGQNSAEITEALKAIASHVGQTMNELKDAVLSTSAGTKGRRDHKKDSDSSAPGFRLATLLKLLVSAVLHPVHVKTDHAFL